MVGATLSEGLGIELIDRLTDRLSSDSQPGLLDRQHTVLKRRRNRAEKNVGFKDFLGFKGF